MKLSQYEQETIINFNAESRLAIVYTRDSAVMDVFDTLVNVDPKHYKLVRHTDIDKTYEMPKAYVNYRKPRRVKEDVRNAARSRMEKINANR